MLKKIISFFVVILLLLGLFFYQIRQNEIRVIKERLAEAEKTHVKLQESLLSTFFARHLSDVEIIARLHELKQFAVAENDYSLNSLQLDFLAFSNQRGNYDQIRFLDKSGVEKIRVNLKDGKSLLVPKEHLQDKSERYYFKNIMRLKSGQIYLSPLDLSVEHQEIERPFKPVLRIGVPIFDQYNDFSGTLIVNTIISSMLQAFRDGGRGSIGENSLLNHDGFWLSAETSGNEWGFMLPRRRAANFAQRYPRAWQKIITKKSGQFYAAAGLFSFSSFNPLSVNRKVSTGSVKNGVSTSYPLKVVSLVPEARLESIISQKLEGKEPFWLGLFGLLSLLSGSLLWIFLRSRQKELEQQENIARINAKLETKIEERTYQLNKSNKKLSTILETTSQGFMMIDKDARVVEVNSAMLRMLGRSSDEVFGALWFNLAGDENREFLIEKLTTHKTGGSDEYDLNIPKPDGNTFFCHVAAAPLINEANEVEGGFALVSDISKHLEFEQNLKKSKMEAEKNSAAKTLFLSSMSHEFRTPMNSILGFAQLLEREESLDAKQRDYIEKILISGDHLKNLINDILDLAKIEAGAVEINLVDINLCATMHEMTGMVKPLVEDRNVEFITREPETHYLVKADPLRLQQIILNLISNAIKYNRIGGRVELSCAKLDEKWLRFSVVDDGPGITPAKRAFLFEPFNRLGAETSTIQGSGIGLAISINLAELMGCRLGLLEKDGSGCHFYIDLPLVDGVTSVVAHTPTQEPEPESSKTSVEEVESCTLLYIEDNELNRMLLASVIEKRPSFTLLSAVNGRQGVEKALKDLPDLILADIGLPDIDGFAVLDELQKHSTTRKIPVIALSGNAAKEDIEKAYAAGFVGYLTKPINIGHLFGTVDEVLLKK